MCDVVENGGKLYVVGYSLYDIDNYYMQVLVFELDNISNFFNVVSWMIKVVFGVEFRIGGDYIYSNLVVIDVNKNFVVLGFVKCVGSCLENGVVGN